MLPNEAYAVKCDGNDKLCMPHSFERLATREQNRLQAKDKGNHNVRALCRWPTGHGPPTQHTAVQLVICLPNKAREGGPGRSRRSEDDRVLQAMHTYWRSINLLGVQSFHMTMTRSPSHFPPHLLCPLKISSVQSVSTSLIAQFRSHAKRCCVLIVWSVTCVEDNPMQCPCCKGDHDISPDSLQAPPDVGMKMLGSLTVECEKLRLSLHCST